MTANSQTAFDVSTGRVHRYLVLVDMGYGWEDADFGLYTDPNKALRDIHKETAVEDRQMTVGQCWANPNDPDDCINITVAAVK